MVYPTCHIGSYFIHYHADFQSNQFCYLLKMLMKGGLLDKYIEINVFMFRSYSIMLPLVGNFQRCECHSHNSTPSRYFPSEYIFCNHSYNKIPTFFISVKRASPTIFLIPNDDWRTQKSCYGCTINLRSLITVHHIC